MGRTYNVRADEISRSNIERADRATKPDRSPFNSDATLAIPGAIYGLDADETSWARRAVLHYAATPAEAADWLAMLNLTETP